MAAELLSLIDDRPPEKEQTDRICRECQCVFVGYGRERFCPACKEQRYQASLARERAWREERKHLGLCAYTKDCNNPVVPGYSSCKEHIDYARRKAGSKITGYANGHTYQTRKEKVEMTNTESTAHQASSVFVPTKEEATIEGLLARCMTMGQEERLAWWKAQDLMEQIKVLQGLIDKLAYTKARRDALEEQASALAKESEQWAVKVQELSVVYASLVK